MKSIITNVMAPHFHLELVSKLKSDHFSLIIDETTDISTTKELALVTRQYNKQEKIVKCYLYELVEVPEGNAEAIFQAICKVLEKDNIPLINVIGFAADGTIVLFYVFNKLFQTFSFRCICHSAHLCVHMPVKSFHAHQRISCMIFIITLVTVPNARQIFNGLLRQNHINFLGDVKHGGYRYIHVFNALLSTGML